MALLKPEDIYNFLPSPDLERKGTHLPYRANVTSFPSCLHRWFLSLTIHTEILGFACFHCPFPWALTTAGLPCSSRVSVRGPFYLLRATCCLTSPTDPRPIIQQSPISEFPFLFTRGTKWKSLPGHSTASLGNSHLEMHNVKWSQGEKQTPSKKILPGLSHCWGRGKVSKGKLPFNSSFFQYEKSLW